jgi:hypothetical protein
MLFDFEGLMLKRLGYGFTLGLVLSVCKPRRYFGYLLIESAQRVV